MTTNRGWLAGLLVGASIAAASGPASAAQLSTTGVLVDRIVVIVNDGVILQSEVNRQTTTIISRLQSDGVALPPRDVLEKQIVEKLIVDQIQVQRADRLGVRVSDDQLNSALTSVAQRNNMTLSQLPDALAAQGIDYTIYRDDIRREMKIEQLRNRDLIPRISISRKEIEAYLQRRDAKDENEYEISHILISLPPGASIEERDAIENKARQLHQRLVDGEDFAQLAVAYSNGQQALDGGKIGWRKGEQLPTIFVDVVVRMEPGQVSDPIASPGGYHIVKLDQIRGRAPIIVTQRHARHILISPNELRSDAEALARLTELEEQIEEGADFAEIAREYSDDKGTANSGGDLGWANPGNFVPEFEAVLDSLSPGETSEPFRSPFGWHVVELLEIREKDNSEEALMNEAYMEIRETKLQQETEAWLLRLRDEAFVDYRT